jgi:hypothetical protein
MHAPNSLALMGSMFISRAKSYVTRPCATVFWKALRTSCAASFQPR